MAGANYTSTKRRACPDLLTLEVMTLNAFKMWSDAALRVLLSVRSRPCVGLSDELAARYLHGLTATYIYQTC